MKCNKYAHELNQTCQGRERLQLLQTINKLHEVYRLQL